MRDAGQQHVVWSVNLACVVADVFSRHVCTSEPHTIRQHRHAMVDVRVYVRPYYYCISSASPWAQQSSRLGKKCWRLEATIMFSAAIITRYSRKRQTSFRCRHLANWTKHTRVFYSVLFPALYENITSSTKSKYIMYCIAVRGGPNPEP